MMEHRQADRPLELPPQVLDGRPRRPLQCFSKFMPRQPADMSSEPVRLRLRIPLDVAQLFQRVKDSEHRRLGLL